MLRRMKIKVVAQGIVLAMALAPLGGAAADTMDNMDGTQLNDSSVVASDNALSGSGSQATIIAGRANTGSGEQTSDTIAAADWVEILNANAGTGTQISGSPNSNGGDRDSADTFISLGLDGAVSASDLGATVSGNTVSVASGAADSGLSMDGAGSGFSGLYGVNAVAASAGAQASQNVSVNVGAEVTSF